ncbi:MAG: AEC family transporter [Roseibium album]|uniref:Auxin efflux carrier n=1 Tax=Roseibium album TaxID=311410 RepID=A0A0M6Z8N7_9HYPH|nr:AEC family transporter [Roseibium album]MBG6157849.1 putative permease [Labrenzia sp. EL_162]MBG6163280.1 putative permease [Labrenzia sp. EL_195]MBG6195758.1 putative permease [Labrenzia sp. EL_159]CTQ58777.1 auxin efflux carrier [Roseibium album]CTQ67373.1 auxin efflux carrier [Roseibium album]
MSGIAEHVVNIMLPVLLCVLLGYALAYFKAPFDRKLFGSLVSNVGYPALILSHLAKEHIQLETFLTVLAAAVGMIAIFGVIGLIVMKLLRIPLRAYLPPMMLSNVGNIGLPVSTLAFGPEGAAVAIGFIVVVLTAIFTIGIAIPMGRPDFRALVRQPVIYAVIFALVLLATEWKIPEPVDQSLEILGGLAIPIMLLTLGHSLETLKFGGVTRAVILSVTHIGVSAIAALAITQVLTLDAKIESVIILLCFMPPSVATYLAISQHQPDEADGVAGFIFVSTCLTLVTLPIVLTYWATG